MAMNTMTTSDFLGRQSTQNKKQLDCYGFSLNGASVTPHATNSRFYEWG